MTSALIVYAPEARGTASADYPWAWTNEEWNVFLADMDDGWGTDEYAARMFEWVMPSAAGDPKQLRWWRTMQRLSATPSSMIAIERIWAELDIRPVLPTIQALTLVLHRSGDPVERVEAGRDFARQIPGAQFVELAGRDWPIWAGDQDALFGAIEPFLRSMREEEAELDRVRREAKELSDRLPKFDPRSVQPGARSGAGRVDDAVRRAFESDGRSMIERGLRTSNCWGLARSRRADLSVRRRASRVHVSDAGELPKGAP